MSMPQVPGGPPPPAQGSAGATDITTQLQGIIRQLSTSNANMLTLISTLSSIFPRITGTFTLAGAATTTITQNKVAANSVVLWTPTNASAATLEGSAKALYLSSLTAGSGFTVATASGAAAAGTEQFSYVVY